MVRKQVKGRSHYDLAEVEEAKFCFWVEEAIRLSKTTKPIKK